MKKHLKPEEWGWKHVDGKFEPLMTDQEPATADILNVVRCKCKPEKDKSCSTKVCSCRSYGLHCVPACKAASIVTENCVTMLSHRNLS